jgi:hypothetical protein
LDAAASESAPVWDARRPAPPIRIPADDLPEELVQPGRSDGEPDELSREQEELARSVATEFVAAQAGAQPVLVGLAITLVGPVVDESGVIGASVLFELPEPRSAAGLPQIEARRIDGRFVSTPYRANVQNMRSVAVLVDLSTRQVVGFSLVPAAGEPTSGSFEGPVPSVPPRQPGDPASE